MVRMLVGHGAEVNSSDSAGMTPLMWAATTLDVATVRFLLEHGADANAKDDKRERTALEWTQARWAKIKGPRKEETKKHLAEVSRLLTEVM